jgi:hypothetical protein
VLGIGSNQVYVLPTARYKIAKDRGGRLRQKYGDGVDRALAFLGTAVEIPGTPDAEEQAIWSEVTDSQTGVRLIHGGEEVLLASTAALGEFLLATGDKVCLRALTSCTQCAPIHARHQDRVVCVEQTLLWLIKAKGFPYILEKVVPVSGCDTASRAAFGSGLLSERENVETAFLAYVDELSSATRGLIKRQL